MNTAVQRSQLNDAVGLTGCLAPEFRELNLEPVVRGSTVGQFAQHATIFFEGDSADTICQVVDGAVMLYKLLPDGRRQVVELLGPGDIFGFAQGSYRDASAETLTAARIRNYDRRGAEKSCGFQRLLARQMLAQLEAMHDHAVLLGRKSAMERVASFLLQLACERRATDERPVVRLPMTRQEIADYLGLTIETVSRSFSELKRRGLIALEKQDRVRIVDVEAMNGIAGAV